MKEFQNMLRKEASGPFSQSLKKKAKDKQAVNPGSCQEEEDREEVRKILSFKLVVHIVQHLCKAGKHLEARVSEEAYLNFGQHLKKK